MMKKFRPIIATFFIIGALFLSACSRLDTSEATREIVDCSGTVVTIPVTIEKVVNVSPSATAFMTAMGLEHLLAGAHGAVLHHSWSPLFYDGFSVMERYGYQPNAEALLSAKIDLVILQNAEYANELRKSGVAAVCFDYHNQDELYFAVDMLGDIFGEQAQRYALEWKRFLQDTITRIQNDAAAIPQDERRNVYYVNAATDGGIYNTFGGGSMTEYWIETIGANLITSPYRGLTEINQELALSLRPDTVFLSGYLEYRYKDEIMSNPLWREIPATLHGRVYTMPTSMVSYDRFSVEFPMLLDYSAHLLYPEYHDFSGIEALGAFYERFYQRTFTDE